MKCYAIPQLFSALLALLPLGLFAQNEPLSQGLGQIRELRASIQVATPDDAKRVTPEYVEETLSQIRRIVQRQVLETALGAGDLRVAMQKLLGKNLYGPTSGSPFVYATTVEGLEIMVVGYEQIYGGAAIPKIRVMIDGYRKVGSGWQLAAELGDRSLDGSDLNLQQLPSPRLNEAWFLAHGHYIGASRYLEPARIYSFDGYSFKTLWAPDRPMMDPTFILGSQQLTITYHHDPDPIRTFRDTIALTASGPVASTEEVAPAPAN